MDKHKFTQFQSNCVLVKQALTIPEQIKLYATIKECSKDYVPTQARSKKSNFTKLFNIQTETKKWENKVPEMFYRLTDKGVHFFFLFPFFFYPARNERG